MSRVASSLVRVDDASPAATDALAKVEAPYDYDAFISYRRRDAAALARWVRDRLQRYLLPPEVLEELAPEKKALHERRPRIWLDKAYEKPSDDFLNEKIFPALDRSAQLIVISTPSVFETIRSTDSEEQPNWLVREVDRFLGDANADRSRRPVDVVVGPDGPRTGSPVDWLRKSGGIGSTSGRSTGGGHGALAKSSTQAS
jgi:hypothetical protein